MARDLRASPFARNVGGLVFYTALGQSVFLLTAPLIGRIFDPVEFGRYGLFMSFVGTAALLVALNYDFAIPAASTDDDAKDLTRLAVLTSIGIVPLISCVAALLSWFGLAGFEVLPPWSGLVVAALLFAITAVQLLQSWMVRRDRVLSVGRASVTMNVARGVVQVGAGRFAPVWYVLIAGEFLGRAANVVHLARGLRWGKISAHLQNMGQLADVARRYRRFPLILLPSQVIDGISVLIQNASLAALFGPAALGQYYLMRRAIDLPVAFVCRSLSDLFYARFAADARSAPERVPAFLVRAVLLLVVLGLVIGLPITVLAPTGFAFLFGEKWREAGVLAAIMMPAFVANFAVAPVSRIFALTSKTRLRLVFTAFYFGSSVSVFAIVAAHGEGLRATVIGLSIGSVVSYSAYFLSALVAARHLVEPSVADAAAAS